MRKALYTSILILLAVSIYAQEKVTITGKITVEGTGKSPIGIITVLEKGVAEHLVFGDVIGTNRHTFIQKDGTFKLTINKGGSIIITDNKHRYMPHTLRKLDKSQTVNIELRRIPNFEKAGYPPNELHKLESNLDVTKKVKISGKILDKNKEPMVDVYITQWSVFNEMGDLAFSISKKSGEFSNIVLKGNRILIGKPGFVSQEFFPKKDTIVNIVLSRSNPFK